ncbi:MAG: hypothetical protein U0264_12050 [Candidatus Kapaibacterium sp.]
MIKQFEAKKTFILVSLFSKIPFLIIGIVILLVTPILEKSFVLSMIILGFGLFTFIFEVFKAHERDIYSLKFDDEARVLTVVSYKYGLIPKESTIDYEQLWYALSGIKWELLTGEISDFEIMKRQSQDAPIISKFFYVKSIFGAFSEKQFFEIINKLKEVGHDEFGGGITKFPVRSAVTTDRQHVPPKRTEL